MYVRKNHPGGDSFGHQWPHAGDVVEMDAEQAGILTSTDPGEFEASTTPFDTKPPADEPPADLADAHTAAEVLAWVGDDPERARQALAVEQAADKPRTTVVNALTRIANAVQE